MRTQAGGIKNAFQPYKQYEVDLILSMVPNKINTDRLR